MVGGSKDGEGAKGAALLHEVAPREVVGRDTIARFQAQFRAAAIECLAILTQTVERVYCDYHDDFVSRRTVDGVVNYRFFQVKTHGKRNHQWSRLDLFGMPKRKAAVKSKNLADGKTVEDVRLERITTSFVGKLLDHTVRFGDSCAQVVFLTNASLDDDVEAIVMAIDAGEMTNEVIKSLVDDFNALYSLDPPLSRDDVEARVKKLSFVPGLGYLNVHDHDFEGKAIKAIYEYSEVDLTQTEGAEIASSLVALVERKSHSRLVQSLTDDTLDETAGVGIDDLLGLLSISKDAYSYLLTGGDSSALKSASIIQRKLKKTGASELIIESASRWKIEWDNWQRTQRHSHDVEVAFLQEDLQRVLERWIRGEVSLPGLRKEVIDLRAKVQAGPLGSLLTDELLLGGVFSALVRSEAR